MSYIVAFTPSCNKDIDHVTFLKVAQTQQDAKLYLMSLFPELKMKSASELEKYEIFSRKNFFYDDGIFTVDESGMEGSGIIDVVFKGDLTSFEKIKVKPSFKTDFPKAVAKALSGWFPELSDPSALQYNVADQETFSKDDEELFVRLDCKKVSESIDEKKPEFDCDNVEDDHHKYIFPAHNHSQKIGVNLYCNTECVNGSKYWIIFSKDGDLKKIKSQLTEGIV